MYTDMDSINHRVHALYPPVGPPRAFFSRAPFRSKMRQKRKKKKAQRVRPTGARGACARVRGFHDNVLQRPREMESIN